MITAEYAVRQLALERVERHSCKSKNRKSKGSDCWVSVKNEWKIGVFIVFSIGYNIIIIKPIHKKEKVYNCAIRECHIDSLEGSIRF